MGSHIVCAKSPPHDSAPRPVGYLREIKTGGIHDPKQGENVMLMQRSYCTGLPPDTPKSKSDKILFEFSPVHHGLVEV
jgi:hypothetical protein